MHQISMGKECPDLLYLYKKAALKGRFKARKEFDLSNIFSEREYQHDGLKDQPLHHPVHHHQHFRCASR